LNSRTFAPDFSVTKSQTTHRTDARHLSTKSLRRSVSKCLNISCEFATTVSLPAFYKLSPSNIPDYTIFQLFKISAEFLQHFQGSSKWRKVVTTSV